MSVTGVLDTNSFESRVDLPAPSYCNSIVMGDMDNDGGLEIVVNNMNDRPSLLKNFGERKNWLLIKLAGKESNRDGIGARVTLVAGRLRQMDEVRSGGSFISHNDLRLHFGIGDAARVDRAEVLWPSGRFEAFEDLKANQVVVLQEGRGKPLAQKPRQVKH